MRRKKISLILFIGITLMFTTPFITTVQADVNEFPVVLKGSEVPLLHGQAVHEVHVLKYDAGIGIWRSIPFQVDERFLINLATCLNDPSTGNVDSHLTYDFNDTEANGLDDDDEIVFLVGDSVGDRAPGDVWPDGVGNVRYELEIKDGSGSLLGYSYVFTGVTPPVQPSPTNYISYSFEDIDGVREDTSIETPKYSAHYSARWRFDELRVLSPYGSGENLIDRVKHRAYVQPNGFGSETEETWDELSCFIRRDNGLLKDHKTGPVRAIREVQGAASGVNTTYTGYYYPSYFLKRVHLRLHPMGTGFLTYVDYHRSLVPAAYFNPSNSSGVPVDGIPDDSIDRTLNNWEMVTNATHGGLFTHRDEPIPVPAIERTMFYWDESGFADQTGDDEPGRFGSHGIWWNKVADTDTPGSEAIIDYLFMPLAAGTGNIGQNLASEIENPPFATAAPQTNPDNCGSPPPEEIPGSTCNDGIDNDCDGPADCDDTDCDPDPLCQPYCGDEACDLNEDSCTCPGDCGLPPSSEEPSATCNDGEDNDCDGLTDADDPDCCTATSTREKGKQCRDGIDNDCDGLVDGNDPDCGDDGGTGGTEGKGKTCSDTIDNDNDGSIDCADPDCARNKSCR